MLTVAFRVDASAQIGTGHVMRCLSLADALQQRGTQIRFVSRHLPERLQNMLTAKGHKVALLNNNLKGEVIDDVVHANWLSTNPQQDAQDTIQALLGQTWDWLIVDHYSLDVRWERMVRPIAKRIMVIDDLADRPHECGWLVDQTYGEDGTRYHGLLPADCHKLFGTSYALLRPEFAVVRTQVARKIFPEDPKTVHVFFGGADIRANTLRFTMLLLNNFPDLLLKVAVGPESTFEAELKRLAIHYGPRLSWEKGITNMAEHMSACDVAIGAPGMATWERACLGVSAAYIAVSENQIAILEQLAMRGLCFFLGLDQVITNSGFVNAIESFLGDRGRLVAMRELGMAAVDGFGVERVITVLLTAP